MPTRSCGRVDDSADDVGDLRRQHPAVGVTQRHDLGAGLARDPQHLQRVRAVGPVPVEEMLGVDEDPLTLGSQVLDRVSDHGEVLVERRVQRQLDVPIMALGDQRHHRSTRVTQCAHQRIVGGVHTWSPGGPEGGKSRVDQCELASGSTEELGVLRHRARPATLDEPDAEGVQVAGDVQLVIDRQVEALLLGSVAKRRVVHLEVAGGAHGLVLACESNKKTPRREREVGAHEQTCALGDDDDAVLRHASSVPHARAYPPEGSESHVVGTT